MSFLAKSGLANVRFDRFSVDYCLICSPHKRFESLYNGAFSKVWHWYQHFSFSVPEGRNLYGFETIL